MWLKVDDSFIDHPKLFAAAKVLGGRRGRARAFCVFMAALSWTNRYLTDGFVPDEAIASFSIDDDPKEVARALADSTVRLFHRKPDGYVLHDYHDYNPEARAVKAKLAKDRDRKRRDRGGDGEPVSGEIPFGENGGHPDDVRADSARTNSGLQPDSVRSPKRSRARDPDPDPDLEDPDRTQRSSPRLRRVAQPVENARVLKALIWREVEAAFADPAATAEDLMTATLAERCKCVAARAGLLYGVDVFATQLEIAIRRNVEWRYRSSA